MLALCSCSSDACLFSLSDAGACCLFVMSYLVYVWSCLCLLAWFSCADACLPACFPFAHARLFSLFDTRLFVVLMLASIFCVKVVWYYR